MKKYAIVLAGGTGTRFGTEHPKQFVQLCGKPLINYSIEAFLSIQGIRIILVLHPDYVMGAEAIKRCFPSVDFLIAEGGNERFHSVQKGLELVTDDDALVAVHDAARPLVTAELIDLVFCACEQKGNAIPVIPQSSSVRQLTKEGSHSVNREHLRIVQTPQAARAGILKKAMSVPYCKSFTDEATVLEEAGEVPNLVPGDALNLKVTTGEDLKIVTALLESRS